MGLGKMRDGMGWDGMFNIEPDNFTCNLQVTMN